MSDTGSHDTTSNLLHGGGNGLAFPSTPISFLASGSGSKDDGRVVSTSPMFSPGPDGEISEDETSSVASWMSYGNSDGETRFLAPEIEEIPSPGWFPYSPSRRFKPDTVNLEEVMVDNKVLDGTLEHLLQAAGLKRLCLSEIQIRQLCAACGDRVVEPDLRSFPKVSEKLGKALFIKLSNLEKWIKDGTDESLKLDAGVDELTRLVVDELRFACQCWKKLLEAQQKRTSSDTLAPLVPSAASYDYEEATRRFRKDLTSIADVLVEKLKSKSELYKDKSQQYIFRMNNWNLIALWANGNELSKDCCKLLFRDIQQLCIQYLREAWAELVAWLTTHSDRAVRENMDSFNKKFEKTVQSQRSLVVSNERGLRANLKVLILEQLLPPYRSFVERYDRMEKRPKLKYTPEDIENVVHGLFGGSEPSVDTDVPPGTSTGFSPLPFWGIGATGSPSSNCETVLNGRSRVDDKNESENRSSPKPVNIMPVNTIISPPVDDAVVVAGSSGTRTDDQQLEGQAVFVEQHSVSPSSSQISATDLGGFELQDSEDLAEPVNGHCRQPTDAINAPSSPAPLDSIPKSLISTEMQQSSLNEVQRRSMMISPDTLPSSSFKRTPHKVDARQPVLVSHDRESSLSAVAAATEEPNNRPSHNYHSMIPEPRPLPTRLHDQVTRGAIDGDDRSLRYTRPKDWSCDDEVDVTYWEENAEANLARYWKNTLSACILGWPSHSLLPDLRTLQQQLQVMWEPMGSIRLLNRGHGFFLVCFASKEDTTRALEEGPWLLDRKLLVLKRLSRDRPLDEDRLTSIPIWVKIFGVPLELWDREHLSKFGSRLGFPVRMDAATAAITNVEYARICVEVPLDFSFPSAITILSSTGRRNRLLLQYEWSGEACKACNLLGHEDTMCREHSAFQNEILYSSSDVGRADNEEKQRTPITSSVVNPFASGKG